ncbi:MAG: lamin tail domain-containing protein [Flavobacteriales bacterium]|nr:lamin tail domain-containing protein [Flavobacteriales bacterium]
MIIRVRSFELFRVIGSLLLLLLTMTPIYGQLADDFEDGDFTIGTVWSGNDGLFTVVDQGGNLALRSNSPGVANYYLSTPSTLASDARWEWFIDLRFATSGANYVDTYLMSDNADLSAVQNGWFVRMGGTSDLVELYKRVSGINTLIISSPPGIINSSTSNPFKIRVERSAANDWTLLFDDGNTGTFASAGPVSDATMSSCSHFGIYVVQSSAASPINNHFFDDFVAGNIPVDFTAPVLLSADVISTTIVDLVFDEPLASASVTPTTNYVINNGIAVQSAALNGSTTVRLTLTTPLIGNTTYTVTVNGVEDPTGNACVDQVANFQFVVPVMPVYRDVVINEFMADQSPVVGLPEVEFVELFNTTTDRTFDLAGWKFTDGTSTATLPNYVLGPGQYVLITSAVGSTLFPSVPNRISVTSLPSLNNDGDNLALTAADNTLIDAVNYALSWYRDAVKSAGGWTLEQINPYAPCSGAANWIASNAPLGGTPGAINSVFDPTPDTTPPTLVSVQVQSTTELVLVFNEAMNAGSLVAGGYSITPLLAVANASAVVGTDNRVLLTLSSSIVVGTVYTLSVIGVTDCTGNMIAANNSGSFALPEPISAGDLMINEVLYDPDPNGSDFVELYNRSQKTLSLANLQLANETNGAIASNHVITTDAVLLLPGEYILLTASVSDIAARYRQSHVDRFLEMSMPSYNNGNGSVVLLDAASAVLDLFRYDDNLHFTLVNKPEGYSLERIDPDRPTSDNTNWQTASDVAGRATPGFRNSQYSATASPSGEMTIEPAIFSPDNDGFEDVLTVVYHFDQAGFVGTLSAFDVAGREVRKLMENQLLGVEGAISWDGILDDGSKGRMGPYIMLFEVFDLSGNTERYRKTVTLAHRLD